LGSFHCLTKSFELITRARYNTLGSKKFPRPVVLLSRAVITNNGIAIMLTVPEHTPAEVLAVCLQLTAVEVTAGVVAEVVEAL
jgi:hypothetical protein